MHIPCSFGCFHTAFVGGYCLVLFPYSFQEFAQVVVGGDVGGVVLEVFFEQCSGLVFVAYFDVLEGEGVVEEAVVGGLLQEGF